MADKANRDAAAAAVAVIAVLWGWHTVKELVQETMSDGQVSCASRLVQVSCTSSLTVCHPQYSHNLKIWNLRE